MPSTGIARKGGKRPGAGRKPSVQTRISREVVERVAASGVTPLEAMVQIMHIHLGTQEYDVALRAAVAAAPYMHPRLWAVQHKVETFEKQAEQMTEHMSDAELEGKMLELMARMAQEGATIHITPEGGYMKFADGETLVLPGTVVPGAAA